MNPIPDVLETELYRIAHALQKQNLPLIIAGGYGLLLWQRRVQERDLTTLRQVPAARSTEDLDLFFSVEVMSEAQNTKTIRSVLDELGYEVVEGRKNYQFARPVSHRGQERSVKIDLLAPAPRSEEEAKNLKIGERRLRPKGFSGLHAHPTPEAVTLEEHLLRVEVDASQAPADIPNPPVVPVFVPHLFTFSMMKLFAYRDRRDDPAVDHGQHHAYDLYRSVAMMTEEDWETAHRIRDTYGGESAVQEARQIVVELFGDAEASGTLALQEHSQRSSSALTREEIEDFTDDLRELFDASDTSS